MPQNLIRVKQIDQQDLSGFLIDAVESTSLYQQLSSGTINFNSGAYYFYVNPKTVESNKSFIVGPLNYISGDDTNNHIFGGLLNTIASGTLTSLIVGGESNLLRGTESNSIIASDFSEINTDGFNNGILFGLFNYVTGLSGDRNIILGGAYNFISSDRNNTNVILAGQNNILKGTDSVIIGGNFNYSSGYNQILMTDFGLATDDYVNLIGGRENTVYGGKYNSIINGYFNFINHPINYTGNFTGANIILNSWKSNIGELSIFNSIVGGGYHNTSGFALVLIGGYSNSLSGDYSSLIGGYSNILSGSVSNINGGAYNTVYGNYASILGGRDNLVNGNDSFALGRNNQILNSGSAIISDGTNRSKVLNQSNSLNIDFENNINLYSRNINITGNIKASDTFFTNNINVSGTGIFNSLDLSNIDRLSLSGVDITITSGIVLSTNPVFAPNLVYNTGNQNISGTKTFLNNIIYPVSPRTSGINFTPNADLYTFFDYVLTGNSTLNTPINMSNGESITILLNQDASGSRSISFNSGYLFSNGISPTLNLVPRGVDIMQVIRVNNRFFSTFATNY